MRAATRPLRTSETCASRTWPLVLLDKCSLFHYRCDDEKENLLRADRRSRHGCRHPQLLFKTY